MSDTTTTFDDLAQKIGVRAQTRQDLQASLVHDLLIALHRTSTEPTDVARNQRIEETYRTLYQQEFPAGVQATATLALGLPGTGLEATYRAAVHEVGGLLGMTVHDQPHHHTAFGHNDLVMITRAQEPSVPFGPRGALVDALDQMLRLQRSAGGGVLLTDLTDANDQTLAGPMLHADILRAQGVLLGATARIPLGENQPKLPGAAHTGFRAVLMSPGPTSDPVFTPRSPAATHQGLNERLRQHFMTHPVPEDILRQAEQTLDETILASRPASLINRGTDMVINERLMRSFPAIKDVLAATQGTTETTDEASPSNDPADAVVQPGAVRGIISLKELAAKVDPKVTGVELTILPPKRKPSA